MELARAVKLLVIVAVAWAVLWSAGKVGPPDLDRLQRVNDKAYEVTIGVARTGGQALGEAVSAFQQTRREP